MPACVSSDCTRNGHQACPHERQCGGLWNYDWRTTLYKVAWIIEAVGIVKPNPSAATTANRDSLFGVEIEAIGEKADLNRTMKCLPLVGNLKLGISMEPGSKKNSSGTPSNGMTML